MLLQVVDASDPHIADRIAVTDDVLERIGATQPRWYIFNQIDRCDTAQIKKLKTQYKKLNPIFVSAKTGEGVEELTAKIQSYKK